MSFASEYARQWAWRSQGELDVERAVGFAILKGSGSERCEVEI